MFKDRECHLYDPAFFQNIENVDEHGAAISGVGEVVGHVPKRLRRIWLIAETCKSIDERKELRALLVTTA